MIIVYIPKIKFDLVMDFTTKTQRHQKVQKVNGFRKNIKFDLFKFLCFFLNLLFL